MQDKSPRGDHNIVSLFLSKTNPLNAFFRHFWSLKPFTEKHVEEWVWNRTHFRKLQFSSVAQLCLTFCDPMDCSMPGFPVINQLPELAQTHVRRVGDAIQPSHPLLSSSPPAFSLSQHQGLFQWVSSSHQY